MEFYSEEHIKASWRNLLNDFPINSMFNLFIDNPFCPSTCKFCVYNDNALEGNENDFEYYYKTYLPNQLKSFEDIIKIRIPDSIYFGGGTPSLMSCETMEEIFNIIPNFRKIKNKVFEVHPAAISEYHIDTIAKYNFSYISCGIQTFDKKVLDRQNRKYIPDEELLRICNYIRKKGLSLNCDLICYIEDFCDAGLKVLTDDVYKLMDGCFPETITIYLLYQSFPNLSAYRSMSLKNNSLEKDYTINHIKKLRRELMKIEYKNNKGYKLVNYSNLKDLSDDSILNSDICNYYLTRVSDEQFRNTKIYSSTSVTNKPKNQNVLAFGGYKNRKVYCYHGQTDFSYILENNNWNSRYIAFSDIQHNKEGFV